jgi:hypothetical protein
MRHIRYLGRIPGQDLKLSVAGMINEEDPFGNGIDKRLQNGITLFQRISI